MRLPLLALVMALALVQVCCSGTLFEPADAGPQVPPELACATLIEITCGASLECEPEVACEAARLLAAQDAVGTRCLTALDDAQRFPACQGGIRGELTADGVDECAALVDEVCGVIGARGARPCADRPSCGNAVLLANPGAPVADGGDLEAEAQRQARCRAALFEEALYPACRL